MVREIGGHISYDPSDPETAPPSHFQNRESRASVLENYLLIMRTGRPPKPTALKEITGNPGKRPLNKLEPRFSGSVSCPTWLTDEAKKEWKRVIAELDALGMVQSVDRASLSSYCQAWARWKSAEAIVSSEGQTFKEPVLDKQGSVVGHKVKRHPATIVARDERTSMLRSAALFGFDPSSRTRLSATTKPGEDPFEAFMKKLGASADGNNDTDATKNN